MHPAVSGGERAGGRKLLARPRPARSAVPAGSAAGFAGVVLLAAALAGACGGDKAASTLLVVEIDSDLVVPGQADGAALVVRRPGGSEQEIPFALGPGQGFPLRAGLIPAAGGEAESVTLVARARLGTAPVVQQELVVDFQPGDRRLVQMFLARACMAVTCQGTTTCTAGGGCIVKRQPTQPYLPPGGAGGSGGGVGGGGGAGGALAGAGGGTAGAGGGPGSGGAGMDGPTPDGPVGDGPGPDQGSPDATCVCPSDDNPCTDDVCREGVCQHPNVGDGTGCAGGVCVDGRCRCGGAGQVCCQVSATNPAPCQNGLSCQNGTCGACGAENQNCCSSNMCAAGLLCDSGRCMKCGDVGQPCCTGGVCHDDKNQCNGEEVCRQGVCGRTVPIQCKPPEPCRKPGVCQPSTGECAYEPQPDQSLCEDGNMCTSGDVCRGGVCTAGAPLVCDDRRECTTKACLPNVGCVFTPRTGERCLDDRNTCTSDICDARGNCVHAPLNGSPCTYPGGSGRCSGDVCCPLLQPNCG